MGVQFERGVAAVLTADYTGDGRTQIVVCSEDGEVQPLRSMR